MTAQTIINAAQEVSKYYSIVRKEYVVAEAFIAFSNAIKNELHREAIEEEQNHRENLENAMGSHGQG